MIRDRITLSLIGCHAAQGKPAAKVGARGCLTHAADENRSLQSHYIPAVHVDFKYKPTTTQGEHTTPTTHFIHECETPAGCGEHALTSAFGALSPSQSKHHIRQLQKMFLLFFSLFKFRTVCVTPRCRCMRDQMCVCVFSECNCHGKAEECYFDQRVADLSLSLDIRGQRRGGGVCVGCRDYTAGTNCETCIPGFYRPVGVETILWLVTYVPSLCKLHVTPLFTCPGER